jgi:hypothetical protein
MDSKTKTRLLAEYTKHTTAMVDVEHLAQTITEGMDTNIRVGDTVISTNYYEGGMFIVPQLSIPRDRQETTRDAQGNRDVRMWVEEVPTANPWREWVKDNNEQSRCASLSVKCKETDHGAREEMRVKVRKLCLFRWNEETQSYPTMSGDILFRSRLMSFADERGYDLAYTRRVLTDPALDFLGEARRTEARRHLAVLERLVAIPPFPCFYDDKYGFLIKRTIRPARIVVAESHPVLSVERGVRVMDEAVAKVVEAQVSVFEAHLNRREALAVADGRAEFKEQIIVEAMKPERVDALLTKHGDDALERQFDASAEGVGKTEEEKAKTKVKRKIAVKLVREV